MNEHENHEPLHNGHDGSAVAHALSGPARRDSCEVADGTLSPIRDLPARLHETESGVYNEIIAYALATASAWSYSKPEHLGAVMTSLGFDEDCSPQHIELSNGALFLDADATLLCHSTMGVGILCFRGTQPTNVIDWLADLSFRKEPFYSWGRVHGGFYHTLVPAWHFILLALQQAIQGSSADGKPHARAPLRALYLTGHSLGGALAVLAAAMIHKNHRAIRKTIRGVYTFGQPMVGDAEFAGRCQHEFGRCLFRHVYDNDVVPRYPPRLAGQFTSFGQEFASTPSGWSFRHRGVEQAPDLFASTLMGGLAWVAQQFPSLHRFRAPFSWADHAPHNYLRCSRLCLVPC